MQRRCVCACSNGGEHQRCRECVQCALCSVCLIARDAGGGDPLARAEAHAKRLEATVASERAANERLARELGATREQLSRCAGDLKKAQGLLSKSKDASKVRARGASCRGWCGSGFS